jgi:hypothetical protein
VDEVYPHRVVNAFCRPPEVRQNRSESTLGGTWDMKRTLTIAIAALLATTAYGNLFDVNFDDGTAAGNFSSPFFSAETGVIDGAVDFNFDYSTLVASPGTGDEFVPPAPNTIGGTTIGMAITVNNTNDPTDEGEAIGVSPIIPTLPGSYQLRADAFIFFPGSGGGASEHAVVGFNADQTAVPFNYVPAGAGTFYHVPHDSGLNVSVPDDFYRVSDGAITNIADADPATAAPLPSDLGLSDADYVGTSQIFTEDQVLGFASNRWFTITLDVDGTTNTATMKVGNTIIDTFDFSAGTTSGDLVLGAADVFNSANPSNMILFDNVVVTPEPASLLVLLVGALAIRRR